MDLTQNHLDLLAVIEQLEEPGKHPSTKAAGLRLLELWKDRGGSYFWKSSAPWQGTSPYAEDLRNAGLIDVHPGIAKFRHPDEPAASVEEYWLSTTKSGRRTLAESTL